MHRLPHSVLYGMTADHLEKYGWSKGAGKSGSARCLGNALSYIYFKEQLVAPRSRSEFTEFRTRVEDKIGCHHIPLWNDRPERRFSDVIAVLRDLEKETRPQVSLPAPESVIAPMRELVSA